MPRFRNRGFFMEGMHETRSQHRMSSSSAEMGDLAPVTYR